jgi:F-type H+-transporting ATPase subunit delta
VALRGAAARRYAQAVFDIATDTNSLDQWLNDLKELNSFFGGQAAVAALEDPSLKDEDAQKIVTDLVSRTRVNPQAANLVRMLVQRQRLALLPRIMEIYQEMYNKAKGIVVADVTTAVPLDEAHQGRVREQLSRITGKTVDVRVHHDPRILGGLVARIGDELIDASVATRLSSLAERLA